MGFEAGAARLLAVVAASPEPALPVDVDEHPVSAAHTLLHHLVHKLPAEQRGRTAVQAAYGDMLDYTAIHSTVDVLYHASDVVKDCQDALRACPEAVALSGVALAHLGSRPLAEEAKLHRLLRQAPSFMTTPDRQALGMDGRWQATSERDAKVSLWDMACYGLALDMALDQLGQRWGLHAAEPSQRVRFCLRSAVMNCLPSELATLYDPNINLATTLEHASLLRCRQASVFDCSGAPLPSLTYFDEDSSVAGISHVRPDFAAPRVDVSAANSQAASSWGLADEAMGRLLPQALDQ